MKVKKKSYQLAYPPNLTNLFFLNRFLLVSNMSVPSSSKCKKHKMESKEIVIVTAVSRVVQITSLIGHLLAFLPWKEWFKNQRVCKAWKERGTFLLDAVHHLRIGTCYSNEDVLDHWHVHDPVAVVKMLARPTVQTLEWRRNSPLADRWGTKTNPHEVEAIVKTINVRSVLLQKVTLVGGSSAQHKLIRARSNLNYVTQVQMSVPRIQGNRNLCFYHFEGSKDFHTENPKQTEFKNYRAECVTCLRLVSSPDHRMTRCSVCTGGYPVCEQCMARAVAKHNERETLGSRMIRLHHRSCSSSNCTLNICPFMPSCANLKCWHNTGVCGACNVVRVNRCLTEPGIWDAWIQCDKCEKLCCKSVGCFRRCRVCEQHVCDELQDICSDCTIEVEDVNQSALQEDGNRSEDANSGGDR